MREYIFCILFYTACLLAVSCTKSENDLVNCRIEAIGLFGDKIIKEETFQRGSTRHEDFLYACERGSEYVEIIECYCN